LHHLLILIVVVEGRAERMVRAREPLTMLRRVVRESVELLLLSLAADILLLLGRVIVLLVLLVGVAVVGLLLVLRMVWTGGRLLGLVLKAGLVLVLMGELSLLGLLGTGVASEIGKERRPSVGRRDDGRVRHRVGVIMF
jgi:hypothetical protein